MTKRVLFTFYASPKIFQVLLNYEDQLDDFSQTLIFKKKCKTKPTGEFLIKHLLPVHTSFS